MPGSGKRLVRFRKTGQFAYVRPRSAAWYRVQAWNKGYTDLILGTTGCPKWARPITIRPAAIKDKPRQPVQPRQPTGATPATILGECATPNFSGGGHTPTRTAR